MKLKIIIAICMLYLMPAHAQINTNLILNARPPANFSLWSTTQGTITFIVTNQQGQRKAKIRSILKTVDGAEVSTTDLNIAQQVTINDGNTVFTASSVFPLEQQKFTGNYQNSISRTGKLPSGSYQLCVDLVDEATFAPIALTQCRVFFVAGYQLPILMMPANEQVLELKKAQTTIMFRWTPLVPRPAAAVSYRLQVFEILAHQQPLQALRSNQPILDKTISGQTQFIWQPQGILRCSDVEKNVSDSTTTAGGTNFTSTDTKNKTDTAGAKWKYVWSIQALDALGNIISADANFEGRSEPYIFSVSEK